VTGRRVLGVALIGLGCFVTLLFVLDIANVFSGPHRVSIDAPPNMGPRERISVPEVAGAPDAPQLNERWRGGWQEHHDGWAWWMPFKAMGWLLLVGGILFFVTRRHRCGHHRRNPVRYV
jgi:hypothetical protein